MRASPMVEDATEPTDPFTDPFSGGYESSTSCEAGRSNGTALARLPSWDKFIAGPTVPLGYCWFDYGSPYMYRVNFSTCPSSVKIQKVSWYSSSCSDCNCSVESAYDISDIGAFESDNTSACVQHFAFGWGSGASKWGYYKLQANAADVECPPTAAPPTPAPPTPAPPTPVDYQ